MTKTTTRSEAKALGLKRYFNGKPCPKGHISDRFVSSGRCHTCTDESKKARRIEKPEEHREYMARWHAENADKEKLYRLENVESIRIRSLMWRINNPERHALNAENWRLSNPARARENRNRWRAENHDRFRFLCKRWRERNPEKQRAIMFNSNNRRRGIRGQLVKSGDIQWMLARQSGLCVYCRCDISGEFDIDHILPVSRGGDNQLSNLQILCPGCNRSKKDKTHDEYMKWRSIHAA